MLKNNDVESLRNLIERVRSEASNIRALKDAGGMTEIVNRAVAGLPNAALALAARVEQVLLNGGLLPVSKGKDTEVIFKC